MLLFHGPLYGYHFGLDENISASSVRAAHVVKDRMAVFEVFLLKRIHFCSNGK